METLLSQGSPNSSFSLVHTNVSKTYVIMATTGCRTFLTLSFCLSVSCLSVSGGRAQSRPGCEYRRVTQRVGPGATFLTWVPSVTGDQCCS